MGYPSSRFSPLDKELSDFAKVLALPGRIAIVRILLEQEDWITADSPAFTEIPLSFVALDNNLYCLRKADILQMKLAQGLRHYKLNKERFDRLRNGIAGLFHLSSGNETAFSK